MKRERREKAKEWLLFFYTIPSKPVGGRVRIWRRLAKAGALQLKGGVYLLPYSEDHAEFLRWLAGEVSTMGGDALYLRTDRIESLPEEEMVRLFLAQKDKEYREVTKTLDELERRLSSIRKGSASRKPGAVAARLDRIEKEFAEARKTDFFASKTAIDLERKISHLRAGAVSLAARAASTATAVSAVGDPSRYRRKTWVTRRRPFVDRMASAWLIRKFIDGEAAFAFVGEDEKPEDAGAVVFDMAEGEFTHAGDLCTFEVLMKSFGLKDRVIRKIGEIVHELDIKDGKYTTPEAMGIEEILSGIRKVEQDDLRALEKGMAVFEMLYQSRTG